MSKKTVAILFGGQSSEHEVSKISAKTIISSIDASKYYVLPIYITKEGRWLLYDGPADQILTSNFESYATPAIISPDATQKAILKIVGDRVKTIPIDIVFPVLHGKYGEDGTVQGLFELAGIAYVGCGVVSSSVCMDKAYTKAIVSKLGIAQADYVVAKRHELAAIDAIVEKIEKKVGYPCFVKPANAGSSVGISKAANRKQLIKAIDVAFKEDCKIIAERGISGRELECAVLGNDEPKASVVGEIKPGAEFYDFDAKYKDDTSEIFIPADVPTRVSNKIKKYAVEIFKAVDGRGLSRVDFFLEDETGKVIFNEINTLPGFTSISQYPMLWKECGVEIKELIDELIDLGFEKHNK